MSEKCEKHDCDLIQWPMDGKGYVPRKPYCPECMEEDCAKAMGINTDQLKIIQSAFNGKSPQ